MTVLRDKHLRNNEVEESDVAVAKPISKTRFRASFLSSNTQLQ